MSFDIGDDNALIRLLRDSLSDNGGITPPGPALDVIRARVRPSLHIGVTGSRELADDPQYTAFKTAVVQISESWFQARGSRESLVHLHHGMCIGADEAAHWALRGAADVLIHGHPGLDRNGSSPYRMRGAEYDVIHGPLIYRDRNQVIVRFAQILIAAPMYPEDDLHSRRSGTWQTIRMARQSNVPIVTVDVDGRITRDGAESKWPNR